MRAGLHHHSAVLIVNHAGGSALSCRGVLLFSIMPAVYIIMPRVHGSGSRSYCLSFRGVIVYHAGGSALSCRGVIVYHAAGCCYSQSCRRFCFIIPRCYSLSCRGVLLFSIMPAVYIIMQRVHGSGSRSYCLSCRAVLNHHAARVLIIMQRGS